MAPPRYANNGPYQIQHNNHVPAHNAGHQHGVLPPPTHLGTPSFGAGGSSNASPFAMSGNLNNGFDRSMLDSGMLPGQISQMGFPRGGPVQSHHNYDGLGGPLENKDDTRIRNVWKHNLKEEMATLRALVRDYPYIAMDTEFPGIVARPIGQFTTKADYHYQTLRCNVDLLKMIQLGITLFKPDGALPPPDAVPPTKSQFQHSLQPTPYTWQFNFKFSLETDMYARESTQMLSKAGIDFDKHSKHGIEPNDFGALLISSGLVLYEDVRWISFHSGYDIGYLIKLMICKPLPEDETAFHKYLEKFFPALFDIKFMIKHAGAKGQVNSGQTLTQEAALIVQRIMSKSGLQDIADELAVTRMGQAHQAGSDSLLTGQIYFKMKEKIFGGIVEEDKYTGQVWGLNAQMPTSTGAPGTSRDFSTPNMNGATFYNQNGTPSTPQTGNAGMAGSGTTTHTPVPSAHVTPGGFGNFQYQKTAMS
jgi:CCR4-NOT transcription complex subunit 7/8